LAIAALLAVPLLASSVSGLHAGPRSAAINGWIAFTSDRDGGDRDIYGMNVDGSRQRRLTRNRADDHVK